MFGPFRQYPV